MRKGLLLLLGVILIAILSYFCFMGKANGIKENLVSQSQIAYKDKQLDWVNVDISGQDLEMTRNLVLTGIAPTKEKRQEAELIAQNIDGVMSVDNQIVIDTPKPKVVEEVAEVKEIVATAPVVVPPSPYTIDVEKDKSNKITLRGYVENAEEHNKLVAKAKTLFGDENVIDELKEASGSPVSWGDSSMLGLEKVAVVDYGKFNISDKDFNFEGYVGAEETKSRLVSSLKENLDNNYIGTYNVTAPEVKVAEITDNDISVPVPSPYTIDVEKDKSNKITLRGYVENVEEHDRLVAKAKTLFGDENVIDELKEASGSPVSWGDSSMLGLEKLAVVDYGKFNISDKDFNFEGYVGAEETKSRLVSNLKENLDNNYIGTYNVTAPEVKIVKSLSCQKQFKELLSQEKILFEYDKAVIKKESYALLDKVIEIANKCPNSKIEIEGHTDSDGSKKYNQKLSFKRANAVKKYLIKSNVQSDRLKAIGYGEIKPIATNKTKEGKEQNRRIEFNVKGAE